MALCLLVLPPSNVVNVTGTVKYSHFGVVGQFEILERIVYLEYEKEKEHDFSITAFRVAQEATERIVPEPKIDFKALGQLGGLKGGRARAARFTPERRSEIANKAAMARWGK